MQEDGGRTLYQVDYDDCGQEDIDVGALYDSVVYHPRLEQSLFEDTQLPAVGQAVMFALQRKPRFGVIVEINPSLAKPLSILLWKPSSKAKSILSARFKSTMNLGSGEEVVRISPAQVKTHVRFDEEGFLSRKCRSKIQGILTRSQRQPLAKPAVKTRPKTHLKKDSSGNPAKTSKMPSPKVTATTRPSPKTAASNIRGSRHKHRYNTRSKGSASRQRR